EPVAGVDLVEIEPVLLDLGDVGRADAGTDAVGERQRAEAQEIERRVESVELAAEAKAHAGLAPDQAIGDAELLEQRAELGIGVEDDVVVAIEMDALVIEPGAESTELITRLEHDRCQPGVQEEVRAREAANPAAEYGDALLASGAHVKRTSPSRPS